MKVLFATIHHKRSLLYEEGVKLLLKDGFPFILQITGHDNGFGNFGINDPLIQIVDKGIHTNYDTGLMNFKEILSMLDWDIVHFLDNDIFITDTKYIKQTIDDFWNSDFGYASYFENGNNYDMSVYDFKDKTMAHMTNQKFIDKPSDIGGIKGVPQWENAMMMFKREVWDSLVADDLSYTPKYIKKMWDMGVKMAVKKKGERMTYTHTGDGWIHVGNLFPYYYKVEELGQVNPESDLDASRIGYFLYQKKRFKTNYAPVIEAHLTILAQGMGGEKRCLDAWLRLVEGYYE